MNRVSPCTNRAPHAYKAKETSATRLLKVMIIVADIAALLGVYSLAGHHIPAPRMILFSHTYSVYMSAAGVGGLALSLFLLSKRKITSALDEVTALLPQQTIEVDELSNYHALQYKLADMSNDIKKRGNRAQKQSWSLLLSRLDKKSVQCKVGQQICSYTLDCTREIAKMKSRRKLQTTLTVEELSESSHEQDKMGLAKALSEFSGDTMEQAQKSIKRHLSFRHRCIVVKESDEVLGGVFIRCTGGENELHTLCRRASAAKCGMTETLKRYFWENYGHRAPSSFWCTLLKSQVIAYGIYSQMGFKITQYEESALTMRLQAGSR